MYCPNKSLQQLPIQLEKVPYWCEGEMLHIGLKAVTCTKTIEQIDQNLSCSLGVLTSNSPIVCNSTSTFVFCHYGNLPLDHASFIPTTRSPQKGNSTQTPKKESSFLGNVKIFLIVLFSGSKTVSTKKFVEGSTKFNYENAVWKPKAYAVEN